MGDLQKKQGTLIALAKVLQISHIAHLSNILKQTYPAMLSSTEIINIYLQSQAWVFTSPVLLALQSPQHVHTPEKVSGVDPKDLYHTTDIASAAEGSPKGQWPAGLSLLRKPKKSSLT